MRARYTIGGKVRIDLPHDFEHEMREDPRRLVLTVPADAFEELAAQIREGDEVRAELRRSLSEAERKVRRLSTERAALAEERDALRHLQHVAPARMVIHTTAEEKAVWTDTDMATADVLDRIAATATVGSLVDDLKNTIVSQAREIARLKGESA